MGIFDKIKNALFEEEYVEVEEPRKKKKVKEKSKKEEHNKKEVDKPIAKKVVLPDKREDFFEEKSEVVEENDITTDSKEDFKFPMMDEDDFKVEDNYRKEEPEIVKVIEDEVIEEEKYTSYYGEAKPYQGKSKPLYGIDEDDRIKMHEYGTYDKHEEKKTFKPSPIISPIYGVLDKNYKKEEIVTKKEVRLTSSYKRENMSLDEVRKKAYGTLSDELAREINEPSLKEDLEDVKVEENLLVDLSSDEEKPQVHEVTMGDAEEYFQDLGLEYNIDYKDVAKEKATGRREKAHYDSDDVENTTEIEKEVENTDLDSEIDKVVDEEVKENNDDNLFDLIDSMYEEE